MRREVDIGHFVSTAKSCINIVSTVKYSEISELAHESELIKTHLYFVENSILIHQSFLTCTLERVKFVARDN